GAEFLEGRHLGQQGRTRFAEDGQRTQLAGLDVGQRRRYRLRRDLGIVAENGDDGRPAAVGWKVAQAQRTRRLFQIGQGQMAGAVKSTRTEHQPTGMRFDAFEKLLQRLVRLLLIDEEQDGIRDQAREWYEVGAGPFDRTSEQL